MCSQGFQADFDSFAGRTLVNSGVTERIIRTCDTFSRIEHDHCVGTEELGAFPCGDGPTVVPESPGPSGAQSRFLVVQGLVGVSIMAVWSSWIDV